MTTVFKKFAYSFALVAVGAVGGFCFSSGSAPAGDPETARVLNKPVGKAAAGDSAEVKMLRRKVRELEKQLARREETAIPVAMNVPAPQPEAPRPPESMSERMSRLERENPVRYAEITNRISQWRRSRAERAQAKMDFLSSIDVSGMSADARKTHVRLQELTLAREELEERMHSRDITDEKRRELFREMREYDRELGDLNRRERDNLLSETVKNLGFSGDSAAEITATIKEVVEATDTMRHFGRRRH
jgi:hypothetical protein